MPPRLGQLIAATTIWVMLSTAAFAQGCVPERPAGPNILAATPVTGPFCVASLPGGNEHTVLWTVRDVDASTLWDVKLEPLPGVLASISIDTVSVDSAGVPSTLAYARLDNWSRQGDVAFEGLLLAPGRYLLRVDTQGLGLFRLFASPAATLPPLAAAPSAESETFDQALTSDGQELRIPWQLSPTGAQQNWTVTAKTAGLPAALSLVSPDAGTIAVAYTNGGSAQLADLGLMPGSYEVLVSGLPPGSNVLVRASPEKMRGPTVESEPNNSADSPFPLPIDTPISGRLLGSTAGLDTDHFLLTVPDQWRFEQFDVVLEAPADARLALMDATGKALQERRGTDKVTLADLVLSPGPYLLSVTGSLGRDEFYTLALVRRGTHDANSEAEPNDDLETASALPDVLTVRGTLRGEDSDIFRFTVAGAPELWRVAGSGAALSRVSHIDRAGPARSTQGWPTDGEVQLSGLLLLPGEHFVEVQGSGDYTLSITREGPFDPLRDEVEPNNEEPAAQPIALSTPRTGRVGWHRDQDFYRFHLPGQTRLQVQLTGVGDQETFAALRHEGDTRDLALLVAPAATAGSLVWEGELQGGDYLLAVSGSAPSEQYYKLGVAPLSWTIATPDLEPNDDPGTARQLPPDLTIAGSLHRGDVDLYLLPEMAAGKLMLRSKSPAIASAPPTVIAVSEDQNPLAAPTPAETFYLSQVEDEAWSVELPARKGLVLSLAGGEGEYNATLELPGVVAASAPPVTATLSLATPMVAANLSTAQRVDGVLALSNAGSEPVDLRLSMNVGHERWLGSLETDAVVLAAGETRQVPVQVDVAPEAEPKRPIAVVAGAATREGHVFVGEAALSADEGVAEVAPFAAAPLPEGLLGGFNVAWSALGATISGGHEALIDGLIGPGGVLTLTLDAAGVPMPVIDLMGDEAMPIAGVVLDTTSFASVRQRLRDFAISISIDGVAFETILEGRLSSRPGEQGFRFDTPVPARFVRLEPLGNHDGPGNPYFDVAELKVIAAGPVTPEGGLVVSRPSLGGHVVWMSPGIPDPQALLTPEAERPYADTGRERAEPVEWVIAFRENRAIRIGRMEWQDDATSDAQYLAQSVVFSVSTASPRGPWTPVGEWKLKRGPDGSVAPFEFAEPQWARYVRFSIAPPFDLWVSLPETLSLFEAVHDTGPGSSLGEWGVGRSEALYEQLFPPSSAAAVAAGDDAPDARQDAQLLPPDIALSDAVQLGIDEDWFRIEVPQDRPRLKLVLAGTADEVSIDLVNAGGEPVELRMGMPSADRTEYEADLEPGAYFVRVHEPERSIVVAWDTSGSVLSHLPEIVKSVITLISSIEVEREAAMLVPFRGAPSPPLLDDWSADPLAILTALQNYPWSDSSSNAEAALLSAANELAKRPGARAIVVITDAESDGATLSDQLWAALAQTRPRIFVLGVPTGTTGAEALTSRAMMHDWANLNGGWVTVLTTPADAEQAFARLASQLRRVKPYVLTALLAPRPIPGQLAVSTSPDTQGSSPTQRQMLVGDRAVEIILDASGSMLQRLEGRQKIEIAKEILTDLVDGFLPHGSPFALRVFGQGNSGSCDTELILSLAGLDPASTRGAIGSISPIDGAKTPIAAALRAVAEDLALAGGRRLVVLLTDGEETCDGDVAAEIATLRAAGFDLRVNIVGIALNDASLEAEFDRWAKQGGGLYFGADHPDALRAAMRSALSPEFQVRDAHGTEVARGTLGAPPLNLEPGDYTVTVLSRPPRQFEITIAPGELTELAP